MNSTSIESLKIYQLAVIFSIFISLAGFSYNVWRMEVTENNNNIRTACFELLRNLSALEQLVYAAHYDKNDEAGNPRNGWVLVGLIEDMSMLTVDSIEGQARSLKSTWSEDWSTMAQSRQETDDIVEAIDATRAEIKQTLNQLD